MEKKEIMTDENQLSSEEIKKLRDLIDTEEIKKLRLKYSYHMDARELDKLRQNLDKYLECNSLKDCDKFLPI